jgi:hypothetical protein
MVQPACGPDVLKVTKARWVAFGFAALVLGIGSRGKG